MNKNNPIKQHTTPIVYLQGFLNNKDLLHLFDLKTRKFLELPPKVTTVIKDFYTIEDENGKNYSIERFLGNIIESSYREVINEIMFYERITKLQKEYLSYFIAFQYLRTPKFRSSHEITTKDMYLKLSEMSLRMHKAYYGETEFSKHHSLESITDTLDLIESDQVNINVPKESHLSFMIDSADKVASILYEQNWHFIKPSKKSQFITSDHPFFMSRPTDLPEWRGVGLATEGSSKFIPLHHNLGLTIMNKGNNVIFSTVSREIMKTFNLSIALSSHRFIISKNKPLLERTVKNMKLKPLS